MRESRSFSNASVHALSALARIGKPLSIVAEDDKITLSIISPNLAFSVHNHLS